MPGILPMKVIKVGSASQSRIAQACDRCRSKKIRCDGIRPSCTQCVSVGFECKTSDKLSRRAFPRGYTESLEERVRQLEGEIRELKDLLDEKDEKIDMLSRIHSRSPQMQNRSLRKASTASPQSTSDTVQDTIERDHVFKVSNASPLLNDEHDGAYFAGSSSGRAFIDAFKQRAEEAGRVTATLRSDVFFATDHNASPSPAPMRISFDVPPRLASDQMVHIFFQEWAPLFPVLHRPTFLALYERYVIDPNSIADKTSLAKLHLVFGIAALSNGPRASADIELYESCWRAAIEAVMMENTIDTLQCLILAEIFCLLKADYGRLVKYRGISVSLSHRLGLHQSQKRFALTPLASETRKKVFWTLYTVDCLSAAQLGLPRQLNDEDIHCEVPVDVDDEYVTDSRFLPTLPGESTKLSSALALFRLSRLLSRVLSENYPASESHEISLRKISSLSDDLDTWMSELPPHLRLQYAQDKPSTNVINSRTPVLALAYEYTRILIHRPVVCVNLGDRASSSVIAIASSSRHIIQITQLLDERSLSFSMCLNKAELLTVAGFGILFQTLSADQGGKVIKESKRLVAIVSDLLDRGAAPGAREFRRLSASLITSPELHSRPSTAHSSGGNDEAVTSSQESLVSSPWSLKALASRISNGGTGHVHKNQMQPRRATMSDPRPNLELLGRLGNFSAVNVSSTPIESPHYKPNRSSFDSHSSISPQTQSLRLEKAARNTNLDFLSFPGNPPARESKRRTAPERSRALHLSPSSLQPPKRSPGRSPSNSGTRKTDSGGQFTEWERLLGSLDNGRSNIYDTIYGGMAPEALASLSSRPASSSTGGAPVVVSNSTAMDEHNQWELLPRSGELWSYGTPTALGTSNCPPQSVLSFSDESLTSGGEEFAVDFGMTSTAPPSDYHNILVRDLDSPANGDMGLDVNLGI